MMEDVELPPELQDIERDLMGRERVQAPPGFRERLAHRIGEELRRERARGLLAFAAGLAAAVVLCLNFSMTAAGSIEFELQVADGRPPVQALARQIQEAVPDLPPREALRQAILLSERAGLPGSPGAVGPGPRIPWRFPRGQDAHGNEFGFFPRDFTEEIEGRGR
jgi:hypothetical protein